MSDSGVVFPLSSQREKKSNDINKKVLPPKNTFPCKVSLLGPAPRMGAVVDFH